TVHVLFSTGELLVHAGDPTRAGEVAQRMAETGSPLLAAESAYVEGLVRADAGDRVAAADALTRSLQAFATLRMPFHQARSDLELARVTRDVERTTNAAAVFRRIGAAIHLQRAENALAELGVRPARTRVPTRRGGPLSSRESEVAALVADGLTN